MAFLTKIQYNAASDRLSCVLCFMMEHGNLNSETFQIFGFRKEKVLFNRRNKACFSLFCVVFITIEVVVHGLACAVEIRRARESLRVKQL